VTRVIQLVKRYVSGEQTYARPIAKPVAGTVRIAVGGDEVQEAIDFTVDTATGLVTFAACAGRRGRGHGGLEFDVPCGSTPTGIETSVSSFSGQAPSVPVVEVRV